MNIPSIVEMLQAGVHFGHQTSRWHPKMEEYIFTQRGGIHVINLEKTQAQLEVVFPAIEKLAAEGKEILFVTTKPQARELVIKAAKRCDSPYLVDRWIGGLLTNFTEIKKLLKKYKSLNEQIETGEIEKYTKKEQLDIRRQVEKMEESLGGIASLEKMPEVIFLPALQKEKTTVDEAQKMGVTVIGIADTNANPDRADYVIPANDDAVKSIRMMVELAADAIESGKKQHAIKKAAAEKAAKEKKTASTKKEEKADEK